MCVWVLHQGAWKFNVAVLCGGRWHRCCMGSLCDTKDTRHTFNEVKHMYEGEFAWAAWNLNKREGKNMFKGEKGIWRWSNRDKCLPSIYITDELIHYLSGNWNAYLHLSNKCLCADLWEMLAELVYSGIVRGIVHPKMLKKTLMIDLFITDPHYFLFIYFTSKYIHWWTGVVWIINQLFGLSFWRHPSTADHPLVSKCCNPKFLQICSHENTNLHLGWPKGEYIFRGNFFKKIKRSFIYVAKKNKQIKKEKDFLFFAPKIKIRSLFTLLFCSIYLLKNVSIVFVHITKVN